MSDLRPTLFLAQLSNLLAGNISIVHGVTGSSRTFMGEELAGVDATQIALARIAAGQSEIALVGGSYNGERSDVVMLYEFGGYCLQGGFRPVGGAGLRARLARRLRGARKQGARDGARRDADRAPVGGGERLFPSRPTGRDQGRACQDVAAGRRRAAAGGRRRHLGRDRGCARD